MEHVDVTQVADQQVVIYLKRFSKDFNGMKMILNNKETVINERQTKLKIK